MSLKTRAASATIALVAALLVVAIIALGGFSLLQNQRDAVSSVERLAAARHSADEVLRLILDEETAIRGYAQNRIPAFLEPYRAARVRLPVAFDELGASVAQFHSGNDAALVEEMRATHSRWVTQVAGPLIEGRRGFDSNELALAGKALMDRIRGSAGALDDDLAMRFGQSADRANAGFARIAVSTILALVFATGILVWFALRQSRAEARRLRDKETINTLQRAFLTRSHPLPRTTIGTAYLSATAEASVGGDLFDIRRIDDDRGYVLIADVSGKGIEAAVDTVFIRYAIGTLMTIYDDPGRVLSAFDALYSKSIDRSAFVVAWLGVIDYATMRMQYASAGHPSAWIRRGERTTELEVTGPVLGVMQDVPIETRTTELMASDVLVLSTDGLTEARSGEKMLGLDGAARWIAAAPEEAEALVETLTARLSAFTHDHIGDDLAIVALRFEGPRP